MLKQKNREKEAGITLIALVVTIIVLIILAGVSIAMLVGENGIITQAQRAKTDTDEVALKEKLDMIALERKLNGTLSSTGGQDETDVFLEMMGDKEITQEDIDFFNESLQSYGKQLTAINNVSDIQKIGAVENYPLDGLYILLADVSMDGQNWTPIGTEEDPFTGVFNGNNKTINGLTLTNPEMNAGLFGVNSGSVKNMELTNTTITSAHTFVGGIAGQNNGLIKNCHVQSGNISGTGNDTLKDIATGVVRNGGSRVGGVCGQNNDGGVIQNCKNTSTVTAEYRLIGGICGYNIGGDIISCKNTGEIYAISDITVNCSIKEGLALTAYESLAMGVPIVTADVGGQAELVNENVGKVVPSLQQEKEIRNFDYKEEEIVPYVEAINEVLNNLENYKTNCRKRILDGFTINHMIENMEKQFENVIQDKNAAKIETGYALQKAVDVCKELITKNYIAFKNEYDWLCDQVNIEYFGQIKGSIESSYDYFETPIGKFRLKMIAVTKKLHIYEPIKAVLRKLRKN